MAQLPDWLDPLPDASEQRALDEWAIGVRGIPGVDLMERAGIGLADLVGELAPSGPGAVGCGRGDNGGSGGVRSTWYCWGPARSSAGMPPSISSGCRVPRPSRFLLRRWGAPLQSS